MTASLVNNPGAKRITENVGLLIRRPARIQVAALCYRKTAGVLEVLLVTTRDTRRWIIPKGWPMTKRSARKTAEIEAFEEAGIVGKASRRPIAQFMSEKGIGGGLTIPVKMIVFPVKVVSQKKKYKEKDQRDLIWLPPDVAARQCGDDGLADLLSSEVVQNLA